MTERIGGCSYMKRYGHLYEKIYDMKKFEVGTPTCKERERMVCRSAND